MSNLTERPIALTLAAEPDLARLVRMTAANVGRWRVCPWTVSRTCAWPPRRRSSTLPPLTRTAP